MRNDNAILKFMSNVHLELPGSERAALRASVTAMDLQISRLSQLSKLEEFRAAAGELLASWPSLVKLLALGEAAELRECPRCKGLGMRAATLCGYCFLKLPPVPPSSAGTSHAGMEAATPENRTVPSHP